MVFGRIHQGQIELTAALPEAWEGQVVRIEPCIPDDSLPDLQGGERSGEPTGKEVSPEVLDELDEWAAAVEAATARISPEDHNKFMAILEQVEAESKELGRREMERLE